MVSPSVERETPTFCLLRAVFIFLFCPRRFVRGEVSDCAWEDSGSVPSFYLFYPSAPADVGDHDTNPDRSARASPFPDLPCTAIPFRLNRLRDAATLVIVPDVLRFAKAPPPLPRAGFALTSRIGLISNLQVLRVIEDQRPLLTTLPNGLGLAPLVCKQPFQPHNGQF